MSYPLRLLLLNYRWAQRVRPAVLEGVKVVDGDVLFFNKTANFVSGEFYREVLLVKYLLLSVISVSVNDSNRNGRHGADGDCRIDVCCARARISFAYLLDFTVRFKILATTLLKIF